MTITDDIVKNLRNPTPLYAVAGTADLAAEKLREVPALIGKLREQAPEHIEKLRATDPRAVQQRVTAQAKDAQARLNESYRDLDLKELRDFRRLGESVQGIALQGVGRAAEYAVKVRETYDDLAVRGKGAVAQWRGQTADEVVEIAARVEPDAAPGTATKNKAAQDRAAQDKAAGGGAPKDEAAGNVNGTAKKPAARKTAPRRTASGPKAGDGDHRNGSGPASPRTGK